MIEEKRDAVSCGEFSKETAIAAMQLEVIAFCASKGWEPDPRRTFGDECALLHSEISEALEAYRKWGLNRMASDGTVDYGLPYPPGCKPEGVASEFADLFIRLLHYCGVHGINLYQEFEQKMAYNRTRSHRHGWKLL